MQVIQLDIDTARFIGTENLTKPNIQKAIKELQKEKKKRKMLCMK